MFITVINDCSDANAAGRQSTRIASFFGVTPSFVAVSGGLNLAAELETAGNIVDCLDAAENNGVIIANTAPRSNHGKKETNGTPFGYFRSNDVLVLSSVDGLTLSLVKKLRLADTFYVLDLEQSVLQAVKDDLLDETTGERIIRSQFRSFDFLPRAAHWLYTGRDLPTKSLAINTAPDCDQRVWTVDNFGNCKTTVLADEVDPHQPINTAWGKLSLYEQLKDVPADGRLAVVIGSSGFGDKRFIELVIQGKNAAKECNIRIGDLVSV